MTLPPCSRSMSTPSQMVMRSPADSMSMLPRPAAAAELHFAEGGTQLPEGAPRSGRSPPSDRRAANQKWGHPRRYVKGARTRSGQNRPGRTSRTTDSPTTPVPLGSPNNGTSVLLLEPPFGRTPKCTPLLLSGPECRRGTRYRWFAMSAALRVIVGPVPVHDQTLQAGTVGQ